MARIVEETTRIGQPAWAKDPIGNRESLVPFPAKIDPSQFNDYHAVVVKANGAAAAAAESITVDALTGPIPAGTNLYFGSGEFARLTEDAATGDTSIAVEALVAGIEDNDEARYSTYPDTKFIPSGTLVGRTFAERDANDPFGLAIDTDDEIYFLAFDVPNAEVETDCELYRHGRTVAENQLPDHVVSYLAANAGLLAEVRSLYVCINGED
jgi:hypothetical protein